MFFILPVGVDYRAHRWPVVTFCLMGICTLLFLLGIGLYLAQSSPENQGYDPLLQHFGFIPNQAHPITWVTHMFLHAGLFHLLGNMIYLYLFGSVLEDTLGRGRFLAFFLIGGVLAAGVHSVLAGPVQANLPLVGASGAISACLGGFVLLYPRTQIEFKYFFWIIVYAVSNEFYVASWIVISLWFFLDLTSLLLEMGNASRGGGVAFGAHIGGMLAGLALVALNQKVTSWRDQEPSIPTPPRHSESDVQTIYLTHDGNTTGPYSRAEIQQMRLTGSLDSGVSYWEEGMPEWLPIEDL